MPNRQKIESYLAAIAKKNFRQTLEPMIEACHLLKDPQEDYVSIHIAGTNGKGSTAAFLNSILQEAGPKVGLITSPHLTHLTERIQINRRPIPFEALSEVIDEIRKRLPSEDYLSYFEMMTLAGFEHFSKMKVDIAVVETGMGGRLDATNVLKPKVAVLTPISFDHEAYLGDTLSQIAKEKCGILKRGMTVVSAPQQEDVVFVIEEHCKRLKLELIWADSDTVTTPLGLKGRHQKINAACALAAAKILLSKEICEKKAAQALAKTKWPGRLDTISYDPLVLVDGAHNAAGIQTLADYLEEAHPDKEIHFLIGALKDKNWQTMFEPLKNLAAAFYCVTPDSERALDSGTLAKQLQSLSVYSPWSIVHCPEPIPKVLETILPQLGSQDMLVATGSLYMVGEVLKCFHKPD